ncbi:phenylalanine--tRNA ligase subunit beta [Bacillaceae bacterium]
MRVSYRWLSEYIDLSDVSPAELAEKLTRAGIEVEAVEARNKGVHQVVVGYVIRREQHPNADKLSVCQVDAGTGETLQIVCGAKNVAQGQKVPVALVGATLPGGVKIKKTKLRGVESQGMICSAKELGINDRLLPKEQQEGILVLPEEATVGEDVVPLLGLDDTVLELGLTPNRADCLSMIGVAYEVAAILGRELKLPHVDVQEAGEPIDGRVQVEIAAPEHCFHYMARLITNVKLQPSPLWLQNRLIAAGIRPINNVVDITNYVMLELGQPLHAFDYDAVADGKIVVRLAREGETIVTLDGVERTLDEQMLLITDGRKGIGIAGVMGGANSEVTADTKSILLESAFFSGKSIRRTARQLGLRSEASLRFEKEVDPQGVARALDRAAQLMAALADGKIAQGIVQKLVKQREPQEITLRISRLNRVLGTELTLAQAKETMERLRFPVHAQDADQLVVTVPTRRQDITREIDLIEEVARLYGYDNIPTSLPTGVTTAGGLTRKQRIRRAIRHILTECGLYEVNTYSLLNREALEEVAGLERGVSPIPLAMPMSEERSVLRTHLLPSLLQVAQYNRNRKNTDLALFEMGTVFLAESTELRALPEERLYLAGLLMGRFGSRHWADADRSADFYLLKGVLETLFARLPVKGVSYLPAAVEGLHPGRTARISVQGDALGYLGQLHPEVQKKYDLDEAYVFQLDLERLFPYVDERIVYRPLPKYPAIVRDLAVVVAKEVPAEELLRTIRDAAGALLESVELFDLYEGEKIGENKKSIAFSLVYRDPERTLTDEEVNGVHERIVATLEEKLGAQLRR